MKREWRPLDVGGLRLYRVTISHRGSPIADEIVAAQTPRFAQRLMEKIYPFGDGYTCFAAAMNVYQPASWWEDGVPCCKDETVEIRALE